MIEELEPTPPKRQRCASAPPRSMTMVQTVVIHTVGWEQQGVKYHHDPDVRLWGKGGLDEKFRFRFKKLGEVDLWVNAEQFRDKVAYGHCGEHEFQLSSIVATSSFDKWLKRFKIDFDKLHALSKAEVHIVSWCKAGTHRSVATGRIITEILRNDGYHVIGPRHLSSGTWPRKRVCSSCSQCMVGYPPSQIVYNEAISKWYNM